MKKYSQIIMISGLLLFSNIVLIGQTQRVNTRQPVLIDNRASQKIAEHELKAEYASIINKVPDLSEDQRKQILKIETARNMRLKRINIEIERNKTLIKQGKADITEIKAVISKLSERKLDLISISNNKIKATLTPAQIRKAGI
jgi:Spy/CpxP family protein refolding chaperone